MRSTASVSSCAPAAFDELVAAHKQRIYSYVYRTVGDADEAEDITQDVFVKMYVALPGFRSEASIATWLYRIAGNLCIDRHRKRARRMQAFGGEVVSLDAPTPGAADSERRGEMEIRAGASGEPEEALARREQETLLQGALDALPIKMRGAVILHDIEGLSYEEIAAVEQCPLGTVKSRIFNARAQLRVMLSKALGTDGESDEQ